MANIFDGIENLITYHIFTEAGILDTERPPQSAKQFPYINEFTAVEEGDPLINCDLIPFLHAGDISMIQGKPKSMKSSAAQLLAAAMLHQGGGELVSERLKAKQPRQVLYVDTEQSTYYAKQSFGHICTALGGMHPENFNYLSLREYRNAHRLLLIEKAINDLRPDLCIIDGIRDVCSNFNDIDEAGAVVEAVMKMAEHYKTHILNVLHENPNGNKARGHLGTELSNKCETIMQAVKKDGLNGEQYAEINFLLTRGKQPQPLFVTRETEGGQPQFFTPDTATRIEQELRSNFGGGDFTTGEAVAHLQGVFDMQQGAAKMAFNRITKKLHKVKQGVWTFNGVNNETNN